MLYIIGNITHFLLLDLFCSAMVVNNTSDIFAHCEQMWLSRQIVPVLTYFVRDYFYMSILFILCKGKTHYQCPLDGQKLEK